jgi:hypothetical protein
VAGKKLAAIEARITAAYAELTALEGLILSEREAEKEAVRRKVSEQIGTNDYQFGAAPAAHRKSWKRAEADREVLLVELDALAAARSAERANEASEALAVAIKDVRKHRPKLDKIFAEAGAKVAELAELWLRARDEIEAFDGKVASGRDLAPTASVSDPSAQGRWNEAVWSLSDLGPAPTNIASFLEIVLAAALDPEHGDEYRVNAMRADVGIPDLRAFNVLAHFSGDRFAKRGGSDFAAGVEKIAQRNEPKPEPAPPSAEQLANSAAAAEAEERRFQARLAHQVRRGQYEDAKPTLAAAPNNLDGLGHNAAQLAELAQLADLASA